MKALYELKEMLCKELEEITRKGELSAGSLETAHKLTDTIKNIDKIMMLEGEDDGYSQRRGYSRDGGYSRAGEWEARGRFGRPYDEGGSSYANRGQHYVRGHYSRDDGRAGMRQTRGMYSRDDGRSEMMGELEDMMQDATGQDREIIRRAMDELRNA